eukprot:gene4044-23058_t
MMEGGDGGQRRGWNTQPESVFVPQDLGGEATAAQADYDAYLELLAKRNRVFKNLSKKDKRQIENEKREQGFSVYVNGGNILESRKGIGTTIYDSYGRSSPHPPKKSPRRSRTQDSTSTRSTSRGSEASRGHSRGRTARRPATEPAPRRSPRGKWNQNAATPLVIKANTGDMYIRDIQVDAPPELTGDYDDDFEAEAAAEEEDEEDEEDVHDDEDKGQAEAYRGEGSGSEDDEVGGEVAAASLLNRSTHYVHLDAGGISDLRASLERSGDLSAMLSGIVEEVDAAATDEDGSAGSVESEVEDDVSDDYGGGGGILEEITSTVGGGGGGGDDSEADSVPSEAEEVVTSRGAASASASGSSRRSSPWTARPGTGPAVSLRPTSSSLGRVVMTPSQPLSRSTVHHASRRKSSTDGANSPPLPPTVMPAMQARLPSAQGFRPRPKSPPKHTPTPPTAAAPLPADNIFAETKPSGVSGRAARPPPLAGVASALSPSTTAVDSGGAGPAVAVDDAGEKEEEEEEEDAAKEREEMLSPLDQVTKQLLALDPEQQLKLLSALQTLETKLGMPSKPGSAKKRKQKKTKTTTKKAHDERAGSSKASKAAPPTVLPEAAGALDSIGRNRSPEESAAPDATDATDATAANADAEFDVEEVSLAAAIRPPPMVFQRDADGPSASTATARPGTSVIRSANSDLQLGEQQAAHLEVRFVVYSSWATDEYDAQHDPLAVGLTELQFFDGAGQLVALSPENVRVENAYETSGSADVAKIVNGRTQTTNYRNMWKGMLREDGEETIVLFVLPHDFTLAKVRIWNYNRPNCERMGVREAELVVNSTCVWSGVLPKADGTRATECAMVVHVDPAALVAANASTSMSTNGGVDGGEEEVPDDGSRGEPGPKVAQLVAGAFAVDGLRPRSSSLGAVSSTPTLAAEESSSAAKSEQHDDGSGSGPSPLTVIVLGRKGGKRESQRRQRGSGTEGSGPPRRAGSGVRVERKRVGAKSGKVIFPGARLQQEDAALRRAASDPTISDSNTSFAAARGGGGSKLRPSAADRPPLPPQQQQRRGGSAGGGSVRGGAADGTPIWLQQRAASADGSRRSKNGSMSGNMSSGGSRSCAAFASRPDSSRSRVGTPNLWLAKTESTAAAAASTAALDRERGMAEASVHMAATEHLDLGGTARFGASGADGDVVAFNHVFLI